MNTPPPPARRNKRRALNQSGIKSAIVFVVGTLTALVSAITGLGAQAAFAPMLTWMFGFRAEKAQATALRFAVIASAVACVTVLAVASSVRGSSVAFMVPALFLLRGLLLFVGATVGALLTSRFAPPPDQIVRRQTFQTLGVGLMLLVLIRTAQQTGWQNPQFAAWNTLPLLALLGLLVGVLTQISGLLSGVLMVPALYYFGGLPVKQAALLSLLVIVFAGLLPTWAYVKSELVDRVYATPTIFGAAIGGAFGGWLLLQLPDRAVLMTFAIVAMLLSGRELARLRYESILPLDSPPT